MSEIRKDMTFEEIVKDLKAGKYKPLYFLNGEEPFFIDQITDLVERDALTEDEKAFNQMIMYGNEVNMTTITDTARRFPVMAQRQVIIVREAQNLRDFDNLLPYIDHLQMSTVLLFAYKNKKADKRRNVFKKLSASPHCIWLDSNKLYENKIPDWIMGYCQSAHHSITPKAAGILAESLGNDLCRIANEIDKLALASEGEIDEILVEENTGISKDFNTFELQAAIIRKDFVKANRIANYFQANPRNNPLVLTVAMLFKYFLNLLTYHYQKKETPNIQEMARILGINAFFMKDYTEGAKAYNAVKCAAIISLLREYDMKSKGVGNAGTSEGELLKELIFKIMH